jgi:hypothetical protein
MMSGTRRKFDAAFKARTVFMVTQLVNIVALAIILVLARQFRNQICAVQARQLHVRE